MFRFFSSLVSFLTLAVTPLAANATFIDFDDRVAPPASPYDCYTIEPCGLILSNEYESSGIIFNGGTSWLVGEVLPDGSNKNNVFGTNFIALEFVGALPNFLSFNINSALGAESSYIELYGEDGTHFFTHVTDGWRGLEELSTPYVPNQFVTIQASQRIKGVSFTSFYNHRVGPSIDNLTFEYRQVGEPSVLLLMLMGIAGLVVQRTRKRKFH